MLWVDSNRVGEQLGAVGLLWVSIQKYSRICKSAQEYARVFKNMQECNKNNVQECARAS